jgi:hypothetical protein
MILHETPLVHSSERLHEMSGECWCFPDVIYERDAIRVRHHERALSDGTSIERNRTRERDEVVHSMDRFL